MLVYIQLGTRWDQDVVETSQSNFIHFSHFSVFSFQLCLLAFLKKVSGPPFKPSDDSQKAGRRKNVRNLEVSVPSRLTVNTFTTDKDGLTM